MCQKNRLDTVERILLLLFIVVILFVIFVVLPNENKITNCVLENKNQINAKDICTAKLKTGLL